MAIGRVEYIVEREELIQRIEHVADKDKLNKINLYLDYLINQDKHLPVAETADFSVF